MVGPGAQIGVKAVGDTVQPITRICGVDDGHVVPLTRLQLDFARRQQFAEMQSTARICDGIAHDFEVAAPADVTSPYLAAVFAEAGSACEHRAQTLVRGATTTVVDRDAVTGPRCAGLAELVGPSPAECEQLGGL